MVSDFLSETQGLLSYIDDAGVKVRAREIIHPGKNYDGYWTSEDMAKQFRKAIAIHKRTPTGLDSGHSITLQTTTV